MKTVTRYTRCSRGGKRIYCPHCGSEHIVYHFAWAALVCSGCERTVAKTHYRLEPLPGTRPASASDLLAIHLPLRTWQGVLMHLQGTVDAIPICAIEPDPWDCVTQAINAIRVHVSDTP